MPIGVPTPLTAQEEGITITTRTKINFVGATVTVTEDAPNDRILVTVAAGAGGGDLLADGTVPLTANWDVGAFKITAAQLASDIADGTAPLIVTSTTVVANLNASKLEGNAASAFTPIAHDTATTGVHGVGAGTVAKTADITATKIDDLTAGDDNTDLDSNTTRHGLLLKAVAPAANLLNVPGIVNGETVFTNKPIFDATNPANLGAVAPGTAVVAAHRDHVHANPAIDTLAAATDITTLDATTSVHGLVVKATAPAAGLYNYVGITNAETAYTNKALFDATVPSTQAIADAAATGTAAVAARRDHLHAMPSQATMDTASVAAVNAAGVLYATGKGMNYTTPTGDHTASGIIKTKTAGIALVFGDACYIGTDNKMEKGLADDAAVTIPATYLCLETIAENATGLFLEQGEAYDASWAFDIGLSVYLSAATAGLITKTMPTKVTGNQVQVLGTAIAADKIFWNPSMVVMEYA